MESEIIVCNGAKHLNICSTVGFSSKIFANGEVSIDVKSSIRDKNVVIVQSFNRPNSHLMELIIMIDAVKRSGAKKVTAILPIFPYSRQDRRHASGTPISARVVCDMLKGVHIDRVITIDLHADQVQGFMPNTIQFDHISSAAFFAHHLKDNIKKIYEWMMVSPDAGSIKRTKRLAGLCGINDLAVLNKVRSTANEVESTEVIGNVHNRKVLLIDDMIDTAGTLSMSIQALLEHGANEIGCVATHGIFSHPAYCRLNGSKIFISDSLNIWDKDIEGVEAPPNLKIFPLKMFLLDIIQRISYNVQLSPLFTSWNE